MANALSNLISLVIFLIVVGVLAFIGYQIYAWSQEMSTRASANMEKNHMSFTKDGGLRVGVKHMSDEQYGDKTQRAFVKTWNAAYDDPTRRKPSAPRSASGPASKGNMSQSSASGSSRNTPLTNDAKTAGTSTTSRHRGPESVPGAF